MGWLKRVFEQYPECLKSAGMLLLAIAAVAGAWPVRKSPTQEPSQDQTTRKPSSFSELEPGGTTRSRKTIQLNKFGSNHYTIVTIGCLESAASPLVIPEGVIRLSAEQCQGGKQIPVAGQWLTVGGLTRELLIFRERNGRGIASEFFTPASKDQIEFIFQRGTGSPVRKRITLEPRSQWSN